jgi:SNF2 family DNA or RNA helicase
LTWIIEQGRVTNEKIGQEHGDLSGLEIYDAEFSAGAVTAGIQLPTPSSELADVRFHASVASVEPRIIHEAGSRARLGLRAIADGAFQVDSLAAPDYVVGVGNWAFVDPGSLRELASRLEKLGFRFGQDLDPAQVAFLILELGREFTELFDPNELALHHSEGDGSGFDSQLLSAKLHSYQVSGSQFIDALAKARIGVLLADEMGLGKTMQVLYAIASGVREGRVHNLVVAPASLLTNWQREISKFAPSVTVMLHRGNRRTGDPTYLKRFNVVLVSYETLVQDQYLMRSVDWDIVALDEAQNIKNGASQRAAACKSLNRKASIAVTGTPIETSLQNAHSIMDFVARGRLGSLEHFRARFPDTTTSASQLAKYLGPLTIRRLVSEVGNSLPERVDIPVALTMGGAMAREYQVLQARPGHQLEKATRLRQFCTSPSILDASLVDMSLASRKMDALSDLIQSAFGEGRKVLVFAPFTKAIREICDFYGTRFPGAFIEVLYGETAIDVRQDLIDGFSNHDGPGLLVMNPKAAGVGLNIQAANHVVHFTPDWNPAVLDQASARAHRTGQNLPVFVHYLYYEGTIEEVMLDRLVRRRELARAGLVGAIDEPSPDELARALSITPNLEGDDD